MTFLKKLSLSFLILTVIFVSMALSAPRGSGSFTTGNLQLYKPVTREEPGWLTDSVSSLNNNSDIIASSFTSILNGASTNYAQASGDPDYVQNASSQSGITRSYQNWIQFSTDTPNRPEGEGQVFWDKTEHSLAFKSICTGVTVNIPYEIPQPVVNRTGATLNNGAVVYVTGYDSTLEIPQVSSASTNSAAEARVYGVMTTTTTNGSIGCATRIGEVHDLNTNGFTAGQVVYLGTNGQFTGTAPSKNVITIGNIGRISVSSGTLDVRIGATSGIDAILNQNTLQSGATAYPEFTQTKNLSVYGTPNLSPGASNYIGVDGSNQTKIGSATFQGGIASTGTSNLGLVNVSTPMAGPSCASAYTRSGGNVCIDTDGDWTILVTSVITQNGASPIYSTYDIPTLNSTNAKFVQIQALLVMVQDASSDTAEITAYCRKPGSGISFTNENLITDVTNSVPSTTQRGANTRWLPLDSNKDIDCACVDNQGVPFTSANCRFTIGGYME